MDLPTINEEKQYLGDWTYDLTQDTVVISRAILTYTVEERKKILIQKNENDFRAFVELSSKNPNLYGQEDINNIKNIAASNRDAINSANTHEDLDNLIIVPIDFF